MFGTLEGISAGEARGVHKGRQPSIDTAKVLRGRREEKLGPPASARRLGTHEPAAAAKEEGDADQT
jgi:hypothetical protein